MVERIKNPEVSVPRQIAEGMTEWLKKEIGNSAVGRNSYLDDFDGFRQTLPIPYGDRRNPFSEKNRSHHNRLIFWSNFFAEQYDRLDKADKERAVAQQTFACMMYLSGLFRVQCLMQATGQDDYYRRRLEGNYTGVDLEKTVSDRMDSLFGMVPGPTELDQSFGLRELRYRTLVMNDRQRAFAESLSQNLADAGLESSPTVTTATDMQTDWARLVVDYIVFAASDRDGKLAAVPFLEPKSISDDPQVYYPFADLG